jgi:hypothetical protein
LGTAQVKADVDRMVKEAEAMHRAAVDARLASESASAHACPCPHHPNNKQAAKGEVGENKALRGEECRQHSQREHIQTMERHEACAVPEAAAHRHQRHHSSKDRSLKYKQRSEVMEKELAESLRENVRLRKAVRIILNSPSARGDSAHCWNWWLSFTCLPRIKVYMLVVYQARTRLRNIISAAFSGVFPHVRITATALLCACTWAATDDSDGDATANGAETLRPRSCIHEHMAVLICHLWRM